MVSATLNDVKLGKQRKAGEMNYCRSIERKQGDTGEFIKLIKRCYVDQRRLRLEE